VTTTPSPEPLSHTTPEQPPQVEEPRRLRRSRSDRMLGGVCGGIGAYLGVDPVFVRLAFIAFVLAGGAGVLAYVVAWIAIPSEEADGTPAGSAPARPPATAAQLVAGAVLVMIGGMLLVDRVLPGLDRFVWPAVLVVAGAVLLARGGSR
jgi:phage shock protein C